MSQAQAKPRRRARYLHALAYGSAEGTVAPSARRSHLTGHADTAACARCQVFGTGAAPGKGQDPRPAVLNEGAATQEETADTPSYPHSTPITLSSISVSLPID